MPEDQGAEFDPKKNLIVNYLPASYSQDDVQEIFSKIGTVSNCRLMRDKVTGKSLNYAFIRYPDNKSAAKAIKDINGKEINGKIVKVSYARQSTPDIQNSNVYIAGLPDWITEEKLLSLFSPFGSVISHKVLTDSDGTSRGAGFVRFALNSEANAAIEEMNQKVLPKATGPITVKLALPAAAKQDSVQGMGYPFIGSGMDSLNTMRFNPYSVSQTHTPQTAVALALAELGVYTMKGQNPKASIYVFGLAEASTDLTLYELFSPFGGVLNVKLIKDLEKEGQPCKGYGFVNYAKHEDAMRAVKAMSGVTHEGRVLQVSLKQSKGAST